MDSSDILAKYGYTGVGKTRWDDTETVQNLSNPPLTSRGTPSPDTAMDWAYQVDIGHSYYEDDLLDYCREYASDLDQSSFEYWQDYIQAVNDRRMKEDQL